MRVGKTESASRSSYFPPSLNDAAGGRDGHGGFDIASLIGVAWLIPYCARHHPLHVEEQQVPGTFRSARCASTGDEPGRPDALPFVTRGWPLSVDTPLASVLEALKKQDDPLH